MLDTGRTATCELRGSSSSPGAGSLMTPRFYLQTTGTPWHSVAELLPKEFIQGAKPQWSYGLCSPSPQGGAQTPVPLPELLPQGSGSPGVWELEDHGRNEHWPHERARRRQRSRAPATSMPLFSNPTGHFYFCLTLSNTRDGKPNPKHPWPGQRHRFQSPGEGQRKVPRVLTIQNANMSKYQKLRSLQTKANVR